MSPQVKGGQGAQFQWLSAIQFGGSALGVALFWTSSLGLIAVALYDSLIDARVSESTAGNLLVAGALFWAGILLLPSASTSLGSLLRKQFGEGRLLRTPTRATITLCLLTLAFAILAGEYLTGNDLASLLSPLHVLSATLSVGVMLWLAVRNLDLGGLQRRWGAFASGFTLGPLLATMLELAAGVVVFAIAITYVGFNSELTSNLESTLRVLENDPQALLPLIQKVASDPVIAILLLGNFALVVPLIEEIVKPIAVWILMWRRQLTPAHGFGLGAISGAGFAIAENLFSGATTSGWATTTFVRVGATAFHIATAALMGWALVRVRNEKKYLELLAIYVLNICIHGLWNGVVVAGAFLPLPSLFVVFSNLVLLGITLLTTGILVFMNKQLQPIAVKVKLKKPTRSTKLAARR